MNFSLSIGVSCNWDALNNFKGLIELEMDVLYGGIWFMTDFRLILLEYIEYIWSVLTKNIKKSSR